MFSSAWVPLRSTKAGTLITVRHDGIYFFCIIKVKPHQGCVSFMGPRQPPAGLESCEQEGESAGRQAK